MRAPAVSRHRDASLMTSSSVPLRSSGAYPQILTVLSHAPLAAAVIPDAAGHQARDNTRIHFQQMALGVRRIHRGLRPINGLR